jgi:hypothetical protein
MSRTARLASITTVVAVVGLVLAFVLPQRASTSSGEVRVIHLVVRDMAYYVNGHTAANPTLHLRRGERLQIIVSNQDAGMKHDFGIDAWQKRTNLIEGIGEARLELVAPLVAGDAVYSCAPHGALMRGTIRVE